VQKKNQDNKKRVIVDYKNITQDLLLLLTDTYPDGYEDETIHFNNAKGERVEAVQLETEDTKYLVKVSSQLDRKVEVFIEDQDEDDEAIDEPIGGEESPEADENFDDD
jgi:hypothetical protein